MDQIPVPDKFQLDARLESDSDLVRDLPLCQLRRMRVVEVPWFLLVPRRANLTEIIDLSAAEQIQLMNEIATISHEIKKDFMPDKLNVGALGNVVAQLHVHVIGRFKTDPAWPSPIWGKVEILRG